ncbi:polyketide synthase docking domain-containing protein, partial [Streptomyces sp. NPDC002586]
MSEDRLREYLKRVTAELHRTTTRVRELEARDCEPIAIVSMACRYLLARRREAPVGVEHRRHRQRATCHTDLPR